MRRRIAGCTRPTKTVGPVGRAYPAATTSRNDEPMTTSGSATGPKWVSRFGRGNAEGKGDMRNLLGGKGAGLAEMASLGLPVPPGFTITTEVCTHFYDNNHAYPPELHAQVADALTWVEEIIGAKFGDPTKPLLVSVRSGARASMPEIGRAH